MAYVDLNPIRAGIAKTILTSEHTSVQQRAKAYQHALAKRKPAKKDKPLDVSALMPFHVASQEPESFTQQNTLPMTLGDYLELVDWTGRVIRHDKKGAIPANISPILAQLHLNEKHWITSVKHFNRKFFTVVGHAQRLQAIAAEMKQKWVKGIRGSLALYQPVPIQPIV
jgi:hypothetical protein